MLHRITASIEIFCYFSYGSIFTGISLQEIIIVQFRCPWVCCDVGPIYFFYTWCFLCCCSPRLGKYYCSNLRSLSLSATCHLKLGCFSTFELSIIWLPKCLFCWFSHADFRKTYWQHLTSKGKGF